MNIKFRMPRLGNKLKGQSMLKEMTMTIIATTISIILTFGSASIVEKNQKEKNRRQTVMMVIHDIENNIEELKSWKEIEEYQIALTHYVQNHLDQIESIPLDTLKAVFYYLLEDESDLQYKMDDSMEKLFQENLSLWSSLDDNMQIIDQIQRFFNDRHFLLDHMNNSSLWQYPISKQERLAFLCEGSKDSYPIKIKQILKEKLNDPRVQYFLQYSPLRQVSHGQVVDEWQKVADRLKFMIGVTDEELASYIEAHQQLGKIATKKDLIGEWVRVDSMNGYSRYIFYPDRIFSNRTRIEIKNSLYSGKIISTTRTGGTWKFKGDTLYMTDDPTSYMYSLNTSRIQYNEIKRDDVDSRMDMEKSQQMNKMRDSVNSYINELIEEHKEYNKWFKQGHVNKFVLRIDDSGNKIEVTRYNDDNSVNSIYYIKRKR